MGSHNVEHSMATSPKFRVEPDIQMTIISGGGGAGWCQKGFAIEKICNY